MSLVEIEFKGRRKGVFVNSNNLELKREDRVIVRADRGIDLGKVTLIGEEWQDTLTRLHNVAMEASGHSNGNNNGNGNGNGADKADESSNKETSTDSTDTAVAEEPKQDELASAEEIDPTSETESNPESGDAANTDSPTEEKAQEAESGEEENPAEADEKSADSPEIQIDENLPEVIRVASDEDLAQEDENRGAEKEARTFFLQEVRRLELVMKLVDIEYQLDRKKLTFYFTADGRVDFRELVKSLAQFFRTRIDLRQIGARDESKRIGGIGICGRELCCSAWIREFKPVTTSMLKEQGLLMNPQKNTGLCGKLRCCLRYEVDQYREVNRLFPKEGMKVKGPRGAGIVEKVSMCHSSLGVKWEDGNRIGYSFDQIRNVTDWDPEKRAETEIITFSSDPSLVVQEKEEREGRLLTSFEYEAATDRNQKEKQDQQKNHRKPRRRGRRNKSGSDDRPNRDDRQRRPDNGPVIVEAVEIVPEKRQESGGGDPRTRDRNNRNKNRGRRDKRRDNKPQSGQQDQNQGQKTDASTESGGQRSRDDRNKSRRRGRRGSGQKTRENSPQDKQNQNRPERQQQPKENTSSTGSGGDSSKPKGNPVHSRGRRRKR